MDGILRAESAADPVGRERLRQRRFRLDHSRGVHHSGFAGAFGAIPGLAKFRANSEGTISFTESPSGTYTTVILPLYNCSSAVGLGGGGGAFA